MQTWWDMNFPLHGQNIPAWLSNRLTVAYSYSQVEILAEVHLGFMSFQVCAHFASCSSAAGGRQRNISNDDDESWMMMTRKTSTISC